MQIINIDHLVLTVKSIPATIKFYESVMGMQTQTFAEGRVALSFGEQKINLHEHGNEFEPKANQAMPGSEDLCFICDGNLLSAMEDVRAQGVDIIEGPVKRTGATGPMTSFYFRDPDLNLIEVASYD